MKRIVLIGFSIAILQLMLLQPAAAARLKDIADIEGVRGNQLIGYGVVVGLTGTGDRSGTTFTSQGIANLLERLGTRVDAETIKVQNTAGVLVTAELPPFGRAGMKIDVTLSAFGDASTLQGGTLLMTPLKGADGKVYAVAQGPVSIGGFTVESGGDSVTQNHPTVGRIAEGASVERSIPFDLFASGQIRVVLRNPDFITVTRVQNAINELLGSGSSKALDSASVLLPLDPGLATSPIQLIAQLEQLQVDPDIPARVVINERTGTVIIGEHVRVSTVALAHGNLNVSIRTESQVSQPNAFAGGRTAVVDNTDVDVSEDAPGLSLLNQGVSLGEVVDAINALGATPRDLIAIFQALKRAGALQAELVVM